MNITKDIADFRQERAYYYMRNGILHKKVTVDLAMELSWSEEEAVKNDLVKTPYAKQDVFAKHWDLHARLNEKPIQDGIELADKRIKELSREYGNAERKH